MAHIVDRWYKYFVVYVDLSITKTNSSESLKMSSIEKNWFLENNKKKIWAVTKQYWVECFQSLYFKLEILVKILENVKH